MKKNTPDIATHLFTNTKDIYTRSGPLLRKFSFDELPQIINVIKGELNYIGPRPALYNQYDLVDLRTRKGIHTLIPGITGWAQVNGRDKLSILEKVKMDIYYLENKSVWLDLKIIYLTILKVINAENVTH